MKTTIFEPLFDPLDKRKIITLNELAQAFSVSIATIRRGAMNGTIPGAFQLNKNGNWLFRRSVVEAWWAAQGR